MTYRIRLIIEFELTFATTRVPDVEQDQLQGHLTSTPVVVGFVLCQSLVFYVVFMYYRLSVCLFFTIGVVNRYRKMWYECQ